MTKKKESPTKPFSLRMDKTIFNRLKRISVNDNRSMSNLVNHALDMYIQEIKKNSPELLKNPFKK